MTELDIQIVQDADEEAGRILDQARVQAQAILDQARQEAARTAEEILRQGLAAADVARTQAEAAVELEVRRDNLKMREKVLVQILTGIYAKATALRSVPAYAEYLKDCIVQGALVIDTSQVEIVGSVAEQGVCQRTFLNAIESELAGKYAKNISLDFSIDPAFHGTGVWLKSRGRPMVCDGTFEGALERNYEKVRRDILKEVFRDDA
ncbi:MAG: hypothetical protein HQL17_01010 [Candidatus Omnitrophica bacterium]|nr:hypothetical protein [Candidatus Omnitrophota bacterium]